MTDTIITRIAKSKPAAPMPGHFVPRISYPGFLLLALILLWPVTLRAENTILHLKNGDRIAGQIISKDTNQVVISTSWIKELAVPTAEIQRLEPETVTPLTVLAPPETNAPAKKVTLPVAKVAEPTKPKHWKVEARAGADFLSGPKNQQIYYGRLKHSLTLPYLSQPKQSFRNVADFAFDYGLTQNSDSDGSSTSVLSANRMYGSDKTDFDIGNGRWFVYDLATVGYDELRKINFQYTIGPGLGYHFIARPTFLLNGELGLDYQEQHRADNTRTRNLFFRISQDSTWKISPGVTFTERFEFLPRADSTDFRARAEATLSYAMWRNVSVNLGMLDTYDTKPAQGVTRNDLQVHTSVGVTF